MVVMLQMQKVSQSRCGCGFFKPAQTLSGRPAALGPRAVTRKTLTVSAGVAAKPVDLAVKNVEGTSIGSQQLSLNVAKETTAKALVHRYLILVQTNKRRGTASTLTRSEVRGGGIKPYKQKGTGNARRGSNTSPLFPGGGVSFGPKPKDWSIKMNRKEKQLALATAIQSAAEDLIVVESLKDKLTEKKTKVLNSVLAKVGADTNRRVLLIVKEPYEHIMLAGRNLEKLTINTADKVNVFDVLHANKIVIEADALAHLQSQYGAKTE